MSPETNVSKGSAAGLAYAGLCYVAGVAGLAYCVLFLLGVVVPTSVDDPARTSTAAAVAIDIALVLFWGWQHSAMARPRFKQALTRVLPRHLERATYCLASGVALALVCWLWAPIPGAVWQMDAGVLRTVVQASGLMGWVVLLAATFEIDHAELFGLSQSYYAWRGKPMPKREFQTRRLYRVVRHPIQLGVLIGLWITPDMTVSRLVFATFMTAYILVGLHFEERALVREFGPLYRQYQATVPKLIPGLRLGPATRLAAKFDGTVESGPLRSANENR